MLVATKARAARCRRYDIFQMYMKKIKVPNLGIPLFLNRLFQKLR